jgi:hypothetical protein
VQNLKKIGTVTFKSLINRITKRKKSLKLATCKNFLKKIFEQKNG